MVTINVARFESLTLMLMRQGKNKRVAELLKFYCISILKTNKMRSRADEYLKFRNLATNLKVEI